MNNKLTMLLAAGALVVGAQSSKAIIYSDADANAPGIPLASIAVGGSYSSDFNIAGGDADANQFTVAAGYPDAGTFHKSNPGFQPGVEHVLTGTGSMGFWFQVGPEAVYNVTIDDIKLSGNGDVTKVTKNSLLQGGLSLAIEADIDADGIVAYTATVTAGGAVPTGVTLDYAYLQIDTFVPQTGAPDGGATAMLLGLGTLGVAAMRRKLS